MALGMAPGSAAVEGALWAGGQRPWSPDPPRGPSLRSLRLKGALEEHVWTLRGVLSPPYGMLKPGPGVTGMCGCVQARAGIFRRVQVRASMCG